MRSGEAVSDTLFIRNEERIMICLCEQINRDKKDELIRERKYMDVTYKNFFDPEVSVACTAEFKNNGR